MLSAPTPPTDNLYKFSALSGLIILGVSIFYPLSQIRSIQLQLVDRQIDVKSIASASSKVDQEIQRLQPLIRTSERELYRIKAELATRPFTSSDELNIKRIQEKFLIQSKMLSDLEALHDRSKQKSLEDLRASLKFETELKWVKTYILLGSIGALIGFALSIFGFYFWYFKVQIHLDRQVQREASK